MFGDKWCTVAAGVQLHLKIVEILKQEPPVSLQDVRIGGATHLFLPPVPHLFSKGVGGHQHMA